MRQVRGSAEGADAERARGAAGAGLLDGSKGVLRLWTRPRHPAALALCARAGLPIDQATTSNFLSREIVVPSPDLIAPLARGRCSRRGRATEQRNDFFQAAAQLRGRTRHPRRFERAGPRACVTGAARRQRLLHRRHHEHRPLRNALIPPGCMIDFCSILGLPPRRRCTRRHRTVTEGVPYARPGGTFDRCRPSVR